MIKIILRKYQEESVQKGVDFFKEKSPKPGIIVAPTGAGKSIIISEIARRLGEPTLVLQPSKELLEQNIGKLRDMGGDATIFSASCDRKELSNFTYATLKSIKPFTQELADLNVKNILIDEAHAGYSPDEKSEFMKFIANLQKKLAEKRKGRIKCLGFTATPFRLEQYGTALDPSSRLNMLNLLKDKTFFRHIVHIVQVCDVVKLGFWSKMNYEIWEYNDSRLVLNSKRSEFTQESIIRATQENKTNNKIYRKVMEFINVRKHILVFMDSVYSCNTISEFINKKLGDITAVISSETPKKERENKLNAFKKGEIKVVFNYAVLGVGFDFPELDTIIMGRSTFSLAVLYQIYGRGCRPHPSKTDCLIVDCCNNSRRFGNIENLLVEKFDENLYQVTCGEFLITGKDLDKTVRIDDYKTDLAWRRKRGTLNAIKCDENITQEEIEELGNYRTHSGKRMRDIPMEYWQKLCDIQKRNKGNDHIFKWVEINKMLEIEK